MDENSSCHGTSSLDTLATTQSKRKKPSERSEIWDHFTKYDPGNRCKCNYCGNDYACKNKHGTKIGTSTLRNHLLRCPDYLSIFEDENHTTSHEMKDESKSHVFDKEACRKALTRLIIIDELPFSFVEKEVFNNIVSNWSQTLIYRLGEPLLEMYTNFFRKKSKN